MAATALKQAALLGITPGEVAVQLPPGMYAATLDKRRAEVEAVFARYFGRPTKLTMSVGASAAPPTAGEAPAAVPPSLAATEAAERLARSRRVRETARGHPNIQEAARVLDASIEDVDEL
jgi:DNA polymerase-3 subunit gamma/tau